MTHNAAEAVEAGPRSCIVEVLRALVVEPSPQIAERVVELLTVPGRLDVAASLSTEDEGLAALANHTIDILVTELQLSQGTGFGLMRAARLNPEPCMIVVLTNHAVPALKVAAFQAGADYFLDKSKDFATIPRLVGELLAAKGGR